MIRYKRQHGVAAALVVACGILFWQCWSLWSEQPSSIKTHTAAVKPDVVVEKAKLSGQKPNLPVIQSSPLPPLTPVQQRYLQLANDLRLAHLERALAEEQAGTLQAKTNQKQRYTQNSLRQTAQSKHSQPMVSTSQPTSSGNTTTALAAAPDCALQYVDQQNGHWSAAMQCGPESFDVQVGQNLSGGYRVDSVDAHGVILSQQSHRWRLSLYGMRALPAQVTSVAAVSPAKHAGATVTAHARHRHELKPKLKPKVPADTSALSQAKGAVKAAAPVSSGKLQSVTAPVQANPPTKSQLAQVRHRAVPSGSPATVAGARAVTVFDGDAVRAALLRSNGQLRHANPSAFIVQLFASTDVSAAWQKYLFLQQHQRRQVLLVRSHQGQRTWYKVMVGFDKTYGDALSRAQRLESVHAAFKGWVRQAQRVAAELA